MIRGESGEARESEHRCSYRAIRDELAGMSADEVTRRLPNLVDAVTATAGDDETTRLLVGVSFTRDYLPLDYQLDRVVERGEDRRLESIKGAVSRKHRYLRFAYPPDPEFDACALRGALLAALERELGDVDDGVPANGTPETATGWIPLVRRFLR